MPYQVQFLRPGVMTERSENFETFHEAQTYAAQQVARREPKPEQIAIVELDGDGNEGQIHEFQVS